jgi:hypothetical protein
MIIQGDEEGHVVRVRDIARGGVHDLNGAVEMLRVPYDLFNPAGPALYRDGLVHYLQSGELHTGRTSRAPLGDAHPGERVLVRVEPVSSDDEWWLCDVIAVDGLEAD